MADNLDDVKKELYKLFNEAIKRHPAYGDPSDAKSGGQYGGGSPDNFAIQNRLAIGALAQAIATIESEQREKQNTQIVRLPKK